MKQPLKINNYTFFQFCIELRGYDFYQKNGFQIFKYQLFHKRIHPVNLITDNTIYAKRDRIKQKY